MMDDIYYVIRNTTIHLDYNQPIYKNFNSTKSFPA